MIGMQKFTLAVITFHSLMIGGEPYMPVFVYQAGYDFITFKRNRVSSSRRYIDEQCMAPTAGAQQSPVVPFLQIGDVVMAVGSQRT